MRILVVNTFFDEGGAARAARRLYSGLRNADADAVYFSLDEQKNLEKKILTLKHKFKKWADKIPVKIQRKRENIPFSFNWWPGFSLLHAVKLYSPDIIHLHWVNGGFVDLRELQKVGVPVVWSCHDMWPFTGGCHYAGQCENFTADCGSCYALGSQKKFDLSRIQLNIKKLHYKSANISVVASSNWMQNEVKKSAVLHDKYITVIPNPIDVDEFCPRNRIKARQSFNLPEDKQVILFGAMDATTDPRKGYLYLEKALSQMNSDNAIAVVFGSKDIGVKQISGITTYLVGEVKSNEALAELYSAADVMVVPSVEENLSNAIIESMACGTPVVSFRIGGNPDIISHKYNGYLVENICGKELASGIFWVIKHADVKGLGENARATVMEKYSENVLIPIYLRLYEQIINADT